VLTLRPVTFLNAPRTLGLPGSHAQRPSVQPSSIANRLAIADPDTDTLHLSPRNIIVAMTLLHGKMTGAEVNALHQSLRKKLTAISDLPGHIVAFRGTLGRLVTVGQAPLALDVYRWFLATLSPFPVFQRTLYCLLWQTGQLRSKRLRPMPLTFCRSCIISLPTATLDLKELYLLYNTLLELLIIDVRYSGYTCLHMHCMLVARVIYSSIIISTVL
jgi:hypothetical protein